MPFSAVFWIPEQAFLDAPKLCILLASHKQFSSIVNGLNCCNVQVGCRVLSSQVFSGNAVFGRRMVLGGALRRWGVV